MTKTATRPNPVGRLDAIIADWQRLQQDAGEVIDAYVGTLRARYPSTPASDLRFRFVTGRAGATMDVAAAMRLIRKTIVRETA